MPAKIRRLKKRLFEADGDQQQNNQTQQPATDANNDANQAQNNNANAQAAPTNANAPQQNVNQGQQPAPQPADANNQQNNQNQNQEQQQQQEEPKLAENREKATNCIKSITDVIAKNDPYALLALNIPDLMLQTFPDIKNNQETMAKWDEFKKSPSKESFNAVMDAFAQFANGGKPVEQNQNGQQGQQGQQPAQQTQGQQNNTQPVNAPAPAQTQASNESRKQKVAHSQLNDEYRMQSFGKKLNEQLNSRKEVYRAEQYVKGKPVINVR